MSYLWVIAGAHQGSLVVSFSASRHEANTVSVTSDHIKARVIGANLRAINGIIFMSHICPGRRLSNPGTKHSPFLRLSGDLVDVFSLTHSSSSSVDFLLGLPFLFTPHAKYPALYEEGHPENIVAHVTRERVSPVPSAEVRHDAVVSIKWPIVKIQHVLRPPIKPPLGTLSAGVDWGTSAENRSIASSMFAT